MWDKNNERFRCLIAPCPKNEVFSCKFLFFKFLYLNFNIWKDSVYMYFAFHFLNVPQYFPWTCNIGCWY